MYNFIKKVNSKDVIHYIIKDTEIEYKASNNLSLILTFEMNAYSSPDIEIIKTIPSDTIATVDGINLLEYDGDVYELITLDTQETHKMQAILPHSICKPLCYGLTKNGYGCGMCRLRYTIRTQNPWILPEETITDNDDNNDHDSSVDDNT